MGDFILRYVSIQYILDQMHFFPSDKYYIEKENTQVFLIYLIKSSLQYSFKSECDITCTINNLTASSLGSVTSYVIFTTFYEIIESGDVDIMIKLGRYLILSQFHCVIGPVLLSRAVCLFNTEDEEELYDWKQQWRTALLLFIWLTSVSSMEGEIASQNFGSLLYKSATSGTLNNCIQEEEFINSKILPSNTNTIDRLKSLLPLLPGIFLLLNQDDEKLGWSCQLTSKISYFFQKFKLQLSTNKILKEYIPTFLLIFCVIHFNKHKSLIRETCEEGILDIITKLILICMSNGNELSLLVWKNVNTSLCIILQEILKEGGEEAKKYVLIKICNSVSKSLTSVVEQQQGTKSNEPQMIWNIDMTQGISRFLLFVLEKELYKENQDLLPSLLKVLSTGREDMGWLQTVHLQEHPQEGSGSKRHLMDTSESSVASNMDDSRGLVRNIEKSTRALNISSINASSSQYLLPILQVCLKMILKCMEKRDVNPEHENALMSELKLTLSAALVGLNFCHARDTGLQVLASIRNALHSLDDETKSSYQELVLFVTHELHARYQNERMVKYSNPEESTGVPDEEIFESRNSMDEDTDDLGWSQYAGLGAALDSACLTNLEGIKEDDTNIDDYEDYALKKASENIFLLLNVYLNKWDEHLLQDEEECCSIPLYEDDISGKNYILSILQEANQSEKVDMLSNTNGDISNIIAQYIEIVSLERNRIDIVKTNITEVIHRETSKAVEYNFWKVYRENCLPGKDVEDWERAILQDGGRDSYSRFITMPCKPEFGRSLPEDLTSSKQPPKDLEEQKKDFDVSHDLVGLLGMEIKDIMKESSTPFLECDKSLDLQSSLDDIAEDKEIESTVATEESSITSSNHDVKSANDSNHKNDNADKVSPLDQHTQPYAVSPFSLSPDTPSVCSQTTTCTHSIFTTNIDEYYDNCLHVRPEGSRKGVLFLTSSYIMIEYESNTYEGGETIVQCEGPNFCKWSIAELSHFYLRRYRLRDSAFELFFLPSGGSSSYATSSSAFFDFGSGHIGNTKRDTAANAILKRAPHQCTKQWPEKSQSFFSESLNRITLNWCCGNLSNFDYLMELNILAGRR